MENLPGQSTQSDMQHDKDQWKWKWARKLWLEEFTSHKVLPSFGSCNPRMTALQSSNAHQVIWTPHFIQSQKHLQVGAVIIEHSCNHVSRPPTTCPPHIPVTLHPTYTRPCISNYLYWTASRLPLTSSQTHLTAYQPEHSNKCTQILARIVLEWSNLSTLLNSTTLPQKLQLAN